MELKRYLASLRAIKSKMNKRNRAPRHKKKLNKTGYKRGGKFLSKSQLAKIVNDLR